MRFRSTFIWLFFLLLIPDTHYGQGPEGMNILFIAVDDLKPVLGCYGDTLVHSPNIDAIARQGLTFTGNYCQQAVCAPSRVSLMTSRYPDQTRVWDLNTMMRDMDPGIVSLPQYLRQSGYRTAATGKIFDSRSVDPNYDTPSWSIPWGKPWDISYYSPETGKPAYFYASPHARDTIALLQSEAILLGVDERTYVRERYFPPFESADVPVDAYVDGAIAKVGMELMEQLAGDGDPFFLGIGFHRPHLPFNAPTQFWDLYDREDFSLASFRQEAAGSPSVAYHNFGELRSYTGIPAAGNLSDETQLELIHGYYAAVSYIDHLIGQLIQKLNELGLAENTAIVLWGDHGWHLGDHQLWCKHSNFEQATRSPLIIYYPSQPNGGAHCAAATEFTDIAPTLVDIAGLEIPEYFEGESLKELFEDTLSSVREAALSQYPRNGKMGYSIRNNRYRYTRWINPGDQSFYADELYDYLLDPLETVDHSGNPEYDSVRNYLDSLVVERIAVPSTQERIRFNLTGKSNQGDSTSITGATIRLGQSSRQTNENGELLFTHHTGGIDFQISARGFLAVEGQLNVEQDTMVKIHLTEEYYDLELTVVTGWDGNPASGVIVSLNDDRYMTDTAGRITIPDLLYDHYDVSAEIPGMLSQAFPSLEIYSDTSILLSLDQPTHNVSVRAVNYYSGMGITGARVKLGPLEETTDFHGRAFFSVIEENHSLSIISETYRDLYDSIQINRDSSFSFALVPTHSQVKIWLKEGGAPVEKARVILDADTIVSNPVGISRFEKVPTEETHIFRVEKDGYRERQGEIFLLTDTTLFVQMERITGHESRTEEVGMKIWPNPAGDFIYCRPENFTGDGQIQVIDAYGRIILQRTIADEQISLRTRFLAPGLYWIRLNADTGSQIHRFQKR